MAQVNTNAHREFLGLQKTTQKNAENHEKMPKSAEI
jgi:hypothetical protein